jgi:hypothetical protein
MTVIAVDQVAEVAPVDIQVTVEPVDERPLVEQQQEQLVQAVVVAVVVAAPVIMKHLLVEVV